MRVVIFSNSESNSNAIASFDKAIAINPNYTEAWVGRGIILQRLGRYTEAVASYDKVLAINPNHAFAKEAREIALEKIT